MPIHRHPPPMPPQPPPGLDPARVLGALAPVIEPSRRRALDRAVARRLVSVTVVLERLRDPHNGGAVLRTCEAMGLHHVHVVPLDGDFPVSRKVSLAAHKWLSVYLHPTIGACIDTLHAWGFACWATVPPDRARAAGRPSALPPAHRPTALLLGNEHMGLSGEAIDGADGCVSLPMYGLTESYNLSVSAALALRELTARRRAHLGRAGDLPEEARDTLRAGYYAIATRHPADVVWRSLGGGAGP